jgi:hypothetical protein
MLIHLTLMLIQLTGPDSQPIDVNPALVVSVRPPRSYEHFGKDVRCLLHTTDGKVIVVTEDCDTVRQRLGEEPP